MLEGRGESEGFSLYARRQGRIRRVSIVCWKAGANPKGFHCLLEGRGESVGFPLYAGRQGRIRRVSIVCRKAGANPKGFHCMLEGRGGSRGFTMICWKAWADPEGLSWNTRRQDRFQRISNVCFKGSGRSRRFTMVCWRWGRIQRFYHVMLAGSRGGSRWFTMICWKVNQRVRQYSLHTPEEIVW